jgi:hypothetical protein
MNEFFISIKPVKINPGFYLTPNSYIILQKFLNSQ